MFLFNHKTLTWSCTKYENAMFVKFHLTIIFAPSEASKSYFKIVQIYKLNY